MDNQTRRYPYPYIPHSNAADLKIPQQQQVQLTNAPASKDKDVYQYNAPWPVYALDWCKVPNKRKGFRLAVGSIVEESNNKVSREKRERQRVT